MQLLDCLRGGIWLAGASDSLRKNDSVLHAVTPMLSFTLPLRVLPLISLADRLSHPHWGMPLRDLSVCFIFSLAAALFQRFAGNAVHVRRILFTPSSASCRRRLSLTHPGLPPRLGRFCRRGKGRRHPRLWGILKRRWRHHPAQGRCLLLPIRRPARHSSLRKRPWTSSWA